MHCSTGNVSSSGHATELAPRALLTTKIFCANTITMNDSKLDSLNEILIFREWTKQMDIHCELQLSRHDRTGVAFCFGQTTVSNVNKYI